MNDCLVPNLLTTHLIMMIYVCILFNLQFASVSRDTTLKIWTTDERGINNVDEIPAKVRKSVEAKTKVIFCVFDRK